MLLLYNYLFLWNNLVVNYLLVVKFLEGSFNNLEIYFLVYILIWVGGGFNLNLIWDDISDIWYVILFILYVFFRKLI